MAVSDALRAVYRLPGKLTKWLGGVAPAAAVENSPPGSAANVSPVGAVAAVDEIKLDEAEELGEEPEPSV